jgi:dihydroflavonol-4-reductase
MRAVVLGASGLLGNAIVRELIGRGHEVTAVGRRPESPPSLAGLALRYVPHDVDATNGLDDIVADHDVLVDAAAPYPLNLLAVEADAPARPVEQAVERTERILAAAKRHDLGLVHVSTLLTDDPPPTNTLTGLQSKLLRRVHPYFAAKRAMARLCNAAIESGLRAIILKPTACLGPWDTRPRKYCIVPQLVCGELPAVLDHPVNVIDNRDVAAGLVSALEQESYGRAITLSGHNTSMEQLASWFSAVTPAKSDHWRVPAELSLLPLFWVELAWGMLGRPPPVPSLIPALICEQGWMEPGAAQRDLGLEPRPLADTIRDSLAWYRQIGYC